VKGHDRVVALLNDVLTAELTAINQYFIHARICENWGYERLWKKIRSESIGEMRHADELIARILYLEGTPNVQKLGKVNVGQTVPEQLRLDLELEKAAVTMLNQAIETCRSLGDHGSRDPAGGHPEIGRRARQLDRSPAHAHRASRRRQLPLPADQERRRLTRAGNSAGASWEAPARDQGDVGSATEPRRWRRRLPLRS